MSVQEEIEYGETTIRINNDAGMWRAMAFHHSQLIVSAADAEKDGCLNKIKAKIEAYFAPK